LTAGTRRNGTSKVGVFTRGRHGGGQPGQQHGVGESAEQYTGRHAAAPRSKTARKRAGKAVPAAGVAAALAVGAAAYGLVAVGGHPQAVALSTDLSLPGSLGSASHGGVGSAASAMIAAARTAGSAVAATSAKPRASQTPTAAKATVAPSSAAPQTGSTAQSSSGQAAATAAPSAAATPSSTATHSSSGGSAAVETDIANGNYVLAVGQYLIDNGYSAVAAAGVASSVDGEYGANPESEGDGGGGLIGWTPLGSAQPDANIVTGDASADMMTQLADILYYNADEIGQSRVEELNSQTDPVAAADFYSQNFEKPAVTDSDVVPSVAEAVYSELGG
jgi:hypothetical protein